MPKNPDMLTIAGDELSLLPGVREVVVITRVILEEVPRTRIERLVDWLNSSPPQMQKVNIVECMVDGGDPGLVHETIGRLPGEKTSEEENLRIGTVTGWRIVRTGR